MGYKSHITCRCQTYINSLTPRDSTEKLFKGRFLNLCCLNLFRTDLMNPPTHVNTEHIVNHIFKLCLKVTGNSLVSLTLAFETSVMCKTQEVLISTFQHLNRKTKLFHSDNEEQRKCKGYKSQTKYLWNIRTKQNKLNSVDLGSLHTPHGNSPA